ncbi:glycosyltransferase [Levilactobacillus bambusae]|uniref:Glycosyl transferase n=1 Tax=Levilactobacillus bambusae TaxID=2024736 RepID=A0A2V1MWQ2_9LACO|nr:glycosyltransferase [Levilactobacillus bambusae]PWF99476.1 glycosyl transferase [Levilactobacillus bambusae]
MNYFISENIFTLNSGTEHAQANRTRLFNQVGKRAVYVSRNYNRFISHDREAMNLTADESINMYDYFQGLLYETGEELPLRLVPQLALDTYHIHSHGPNYSTLDEAGRQVAKITVLPGTVGLVNEIMWNDRAGNPTRRENYDWRGFISSIDYFHPDGNLGARYYLNRAGATVIEETFMNVDGQLQPTMWKLTQADGDQRFNTEDELFLYFLNQLVGKDGEAVLISDRRSLDAVIAKVAPVRSRWAAFHGLTENVHADGSTTPYDVYQPVLTTLKESYDGILVPTVRQQEALTELYPDSNVCVIPDTVVTEHHEHQVTEGAPDHQLLCVGRLAKDRRPEMALQVFKRVVAVNPEARMSLIGYASSTEYLEELKQLAKDLEVDSAVDFAGYLSDDQLGERYATGRVLLSPAKQEAFGITALEAMSYGVPVIAFDVPDTASLIHTGKNGVLVPEADLKEMANQVLNLLTDQSRWQTLSTQAQKTASAFLPNPVIGQWNQLGF